MSAAPALTRISIEELKDRLLAQLDSLVHHFAPAAPDSWSKGSLYYTTNPGRADRKSGSFVIHMSGAKAGQWRDYAMSGREAGGDVLDLIGLSLGLSNPTDKIRAARQWLGLDTEDAATRRAREEHSHRMRIERERRAIEDQARAEKKRQTARAVWLSAEPVILGTPVDHYLMGRGIDLRKLPHISAAIRYHPACRYYYDHEEVDPESGEVLSKSRRWRPMPAMATAIAKGAEIIDCHRIFLAQREDGSWGKAPVPDPKHVFGDYSGGSARLCGELGPRGGQLKLKQAPAGSTVYIAEGMENGLSVIAIRAMTGRPPGFVLAAGAIFNFARVELPETIGTVVLIADNDSGEAAQTELRRATAWHRAKGRAVKVWRSKHPGEDMNDALKRALRGNEA